MTDPLQPILARLPLLAGRTDLRITELAGGITNRNYKLETGGEAYVLRLAGKDTHLLGIDRRVEHGCTLAAWRAGVAPQPVAFLEPEGYLLTRFLPGAGVPVDQVRAEPTMGRVIEALKRYHALEHFPGTFSPFRTVEAYEATARRLGASLPATMAWMLDRSREIERALYRAPLRPRPCHNDLLNANFIDDGDRIRIVDWEYAGMGDIFFDLGNFAVQHDFAVEQDEALLRAYFGRATPAGRARLRLMKIMSDLREAMWGLVQAGASELGFDYMGYSQKYFDRFEAAVLGEGYAAWLDEAGDEAPS